MRIRTLLAAAVLTAAGCGDEGSGRSASACGAVDRTPQELGIAQASGLTLCLINEARANEGLPGLRSERRLEIAALRHSQDMVKRRFFDHEAPGLGDPQARLALAGYPSQNAFTGENIAWATGDKASPSAIVDLWMHSPPHRQDILRPDFVEIGVGIAPGAPAEPSSPDPPFTYTTEFGGPPAG